MNESNIDVLLLVREYGETVDVERINCDASPRCIERGGAADHDLSRGGVGLGPKCHTHGQASKNGQAVRSVSRDIKRQVVSLWVELGRIDGERDLHVFSGREAKV